MYWGRGGIVSWWVGWVSRFLDPPLFLTFVIALVGLEHAAIRGVAVKNPP